MKYVVVYLMVILLSGLNFFLPVAEAQLDKLQINSLQKYDMPLRWDNIEKAPDWEHAASLCFIRKNGIHYVRLAPDESITIKLEPWSILRVYCPEQKLGLHDLKTSYSNGSGVYFQPQAYTSKDQHFLFMAPQSSDPLLARIERPGHHQKTIEVALFVSRRMILQKIAPYRGLLHFEKPCVNIQHSNKLTGRDFCFLDSHKTLSFSIQGPLRLVFEHRILFAPSETRTFQTYYFKIKRAANSCQVKNFETVVEHGHKVDGHHKLLGRLEHAYIEVPRGKHWICLESSTPIYFRMLFLHEPDYLLPGLNAPELVKTGKSDYEEKEQLALSMARDNQYRAGGLSAAAFMYNAALKRPDAPELENVAYKLFGLHTFYRNLLPVCKHSKGRPLFARFCQRRLLKCGEDIQAVVIGEEQREALLEKLGSAYFLAAPTECRQRHEYKIPPRNAPSQLRLIIAGKQN